VQLQVVRTDQRIETAVVQVTVDNALPEVKITFPQEGQQLDYTSNRQVIFQAQASDNLSLATVEFSVDGKTIGSVESAPFTLVWTAIKGEHRLQVVAQDRAGNESKAEIRFTIQ
jgi:Bacterial Ig domain